MNATARWPETLWLVRHGQSQGNVARDAAHEAGLSVIDLDLRDVDVPLCDLGHQQAEAAGRWFAALPEDERPEVLLSSPYIRARQTAEAICDAGGLAGGAKPTILDERLREREFGVFDGLTTMGIREKYPEEAAHRAKMGKFYHRPPGGESWADVILRLRSALNTINLQYANKTRADRLPPGRRAVHPLHPGGAERGRHPGHRQAGRHPELRHLRVTISSPTTCPVRAQAGAVEPWRADGSSRARPRPPSPK